MMVEVNCPLISVIVPVYNVEKYLYHCMDSILEQTYQKLEIILVDDGSKDSSGRICDEYAQQYDNCHVIHKANAGLGMARNTGLEHVSGEYVTFVDSDDWLEPDMIQKLYDGLVENRVDMCKAGFRRVTDEKKILMDRSYHKQNFPGEKARTELLPRLVGSSPSRHDSVEMCVCGVLYRTDIIREHGLRFPSERELISEDLVFNIDYMQYANGACTIAYAGYNYRMNPGSLTTRYRPDRFEATKHFYLTICEKLKALGYDHSVIQRLQRLFFVYIKMCIAQEIPECSHKTIENNLEYIKGICKDDIVKTVIRDYPVKKMGLRQQGFIKLVDWCMYRSLFLFAKLGKL